MTMGYRILALFSLLGLLGSMACHVIGLLGIDPPGGKRLFILHIGIFIVWIPLVIAGNRTRPSKARDNVDHLLAEVPKWTTVWIVAVFVYALFNFASFQWATRHYPRGKVPLALELRGFSGHWMLFYSVALAGHLGLARLKEKQHPNQE